MLLALATGVVVTYLALGAGTEKGLRPGDSVGHLAGIVGSVLMGVGLLYPLAKRTSHFTSLRQWWYQAHLLLGAGGAALVAVHVAGRIGKIPTLVALAVLGLLVLGAYGRLLAGRLVHTSFAADPLAFLPADPRRTEPLVLVAKEKAVQAEKMERGAWEGTFTPSLGHWLRHPGPAIRFTRLALQEEQLLLERRVTGSGLVGLLQRNWRLLHLILVTLMGIGLLSHVVAVLFFAGYVSGGTEPYWWYIRK